MPDWKLWRGIPQSRYSLICIGDGQRNRLGISESFRPKKVGPFILSRIHFPITAYSNTINVLRGITHPIALQFTTPPFANTNANFVQNGNTQKSARIVYAYFVWHKDPGSNDHVIAIIKMHHFVCYPWLLSQVVQRQQYLSRSVSTDKLWPNAPFLPSKPSVWVQQPSVFWFHIW